MNDAASAPPRLLDLGDGALTVEFGDTLDPVLGTRVLALDAALARLDLPGVRERVPTYRSLTVFFDPAETDVERLRPAILDACASGVSADAAGRVFSVPAVFGGAFGVDLPLLADHAGMSAADLLDAFLAPLYTVRMIGFLPGFSYLGGLDPRLAMARRTEPRAVIPASSVSIGGAQCAVTTVEGPSGWHLLGRTPVRAFLAGRDPVFLFRPGDRLRFEAVAAEAWDALDAAAARGEPVARRLA